MNPQLKLLVIRDPESIQESADRFARNSRDARPDESDEPWLAWPALTQSLFLDLFLA
jgi:hypothetical protein